MDSSDSASARLQRIQRAAAALASPMSPEAAAERVLGCLIAEPLLAEPRLAPGGSDTEIVCSNGRLSLPLVFDGRAAGVAEARWTGAAQPKPSDLEYLTALASLCGQALARSGDATAAHERLQLLLKAGNFGLWELSLESNRVLASVRSLALYGFAGQQPDPAAWFARIHPEDRDRVVGSVRQALAASAAFDEQFRIVPPGCDPIWVRSQAVPMSAGGKVVRLLGVVQDVTALRALGRERELLQGIVNNIPVMLCLFDPELSRFEVNREFERLTGYTTADANCGDFIDRVYPDPAERAAAVEHMTSLTPGWREFLVTAKDGTAVPSEWANVRISGARMIGIGIDVRARREAERALRESEERFRTLADNIAQLAWMAEADGSIFWYNRRWYDYTGTDLEGMRGWGWRAVHHPDHVSRVEAHFRRQIAAGEAWEDTFPLRSRNGEYRWFLSRALPIRDAEGRLVRWFGTNTDVTEQRATEERLRESEQRYRGLFESMQQRMALCELVFDERGEPSDWRYLDVNPAFEATLFKKEHVLGRTFREVFPEADWRFWVPRVAETALTGRPALLEYYDLGRYWETTVYSPRPGQFAVIFNDVTARKEAEAEAVKQKQQFEALAENAPELIARFDREFRHLYINRYGAAIYAMPRENILGRTSREMGFPLDKVELWEAAFRDVFDTGAQRTVDFEYEGPNFGKQYLSALFVPERGPSGDVVSVITITRDITERLLAEERLSHAQKLESIGVLAGGIAHDFNNLLATILGYASLLAEDVPEESARHAEAIIRASERAAGLTRQLLDYAGKGRFVPEPVNLSREVDEMAELLRVSVPKKVFVSLDLDPRLPDVEADPGQIHQIILNLVLNAAEAAPEDRPGAISIRTAVETIEPARPVLDELTRSPIAPGRYVCFEVSDSGSGMDDATRARIFDPFFTTKFTGRGLGLAAVAGVIRAHGGSIELRTAPGQGATFRVYLAPTMRAAKSPTAPASAPLPGTGTVLVVDDEEMVRGFVAAALKKHGYQVMTACNGREAVALMERTQASIDQASIDVVVVDLLMPVMGGAEVAEAAARLLPLAKVVAISGYSEAEAERIFAGRSIAAFLQKPFTPAKLAESIRDAVAGRALPGEPAPEEPEPGGNAR